ncbi:MAG: OmpH family outer membrane protein [Muribaculaceae bacterium]|nr:OmpH family outer membrane protein [Muribaculaceae bacterium]
MKKSILAAGAVALLLSASCSEKSSNDGGALKVNSDSTTVSANPCNFRYIDLEQVFQNYNLAKELNLELQKETLSIENQARQKQADLQQRGANVQSKYQNNGYLSQASLEADMQDLQKREAAANDWLNTHQNRIANMGLEVQKRIADSIKNFMADYIKVYGYDAILIDGQAGFFKPELDVTQDIIEGLNARYAATTPEKK